MIYKYDIVKKELVFPAYIEEAVTTDSILGVDTETSGLDPHTDSLITIQFYEKNKNHAWIVDFRNVDEKEIELLKYILKNNTLIFFNSKFDLKFLFKNNFSVSDTFDIFLAEWVLTGNIKSLQEVLYERNVELNKKLQSEFKLTTQLTIDKIKYCAEDVMYLPDLAADYQNKLKLEDLWICAKMESEVAKVYAKIELEGMRINKEKWQSVSFDAAKEIELAMMKLDQTVSNTPELKKYAGKYQKTMFGGPQRNTFINWDSPKDVAKVFSNLASLKPYVSESELKTSAKALEEFVYIDKQGNFKPLHEDFQLCADLLNYRKLQKIVTTYGKEFFKYINPVTQKIHPEFLQFGTETGRASSRNPNCQNIPRDEKFRSCFEAAPGYKIITADYSQIEIRIAAEITNEPLLIQAFIDKKDPYSVIGTTMFKVPVSKKENAHLRQIAKSILLGMNYGMGPEKLSKTINCSIEEAKAHIETFYKAMPNLKRGLQSLGSMAVYKQESRTMWPIKRKRPLPHDENDYRAKARVERQGKNTPIQGTNADILKLALIMIDKEIEKKKYDAKIINNVHDEIVLEVKESIAETVKIDVEECMKKAAQIVLKKVPVEVEISINDYWSK